MEWFILSRDMHVLCAPSTDSPNSLPIFNDKQTILISNNTVVSTYDFTVQQKHEDAGNLQMGNYIVFKDKYKKTRMYTLISFDGDDLTRTWHAEDIGLDLIAETANKWDYTGESHPIEWYLSNFVLDDSGWTIGINEVANLTRGLKFEGQSDSKLKRLGDIANQFDGAEIDFTIEMNGSTVTKQVVNIYKKVGTGLTQERFIDSVNLKSLQSSGSIANLCTAMLGLGSSLQNEDGSDGGQITFVNELYDDGRYYSPVGQPYIFDREARQQWSRYRGYGYQDQGEFQGYIDGIYTYETSNPQELLNRTLTELKKRNTPSETYEANLLDISADVGDYVQIAHNNYNPPIYLSARVEQVENCYTVSGQDTGVLGDYRKLESDIDPRIKEMLNALENQIKSHYMWIRYAEDDKGKGMTSVPTVGTKYIAILVNKPTAIPSDDPSDYAGHWQLIKGNDGKDGIPGVTGADGKTSYMHIAYANNVSGTADFSLDDPTGRSYMGVYSDFTKADSNNPSDYVWSLTKGESGADGMQGAQGPKGDIGIPGKPGADGKTSYTHVAYADNDKGGGFSQSPANKAYMGWYTDFTQADSTDTTKYAWSLIKGRDGLDGAQGIAGPKGADGKTSYTHIAYADTAMGGGFSQLSDGKKYIGMYVDFTENDSSDPQKYAWSLIKGADGQDGKDGTPGKDGIAGKDGVGIKSTTVIYQASSNGTTAPTGAWTTNVPTVPAGQYLWTRTIWTYTDNTNETSYSVAYIAKDGNSGKDGIAGKDGVGIKSTTITYATSASGTITPTTGWVDNPPAVSPGQFMWTKTVWNYTDNSSETGYSVAQAGKTGATGPVGKDGIAGKDGVGIKSTAIAYALGDSGTATPTTGWTTSVPSLVKGKYLWTKTVWLYTDNTSESGYSTTYIGKDGNNGNNGLAGKDGVGISATKVEYVGSTSGTDKPTSGWLTTVPSVAAGSFLWTKTTWSYTDGTSESGYSVAKMGEKGAQGPQGLQGLQGATGNQGIQGPKGLDGKSSYTHIAYGTSNSGTGFTQTPFTSTTYIGMYVDQTATDSIDPNKYAWSLIKGADGAQGTPGAKGADGKTPYFHSAWANSADGKTGFSTTDSVNKSYLGTYTDFTVADSTDPTKYAWSLIKGADGVNGKDGIPGKPGADGKTPYFHTAWADSKDGNINFSLTDTTNRGYLGTYTDFVQADSTDTTKYAWSLIKGRDGSNGAPGKPGVDGKTPYFHQAWADSKDGKVNFSTTDPTNRGYLGTYSDFTQADSNDPSKYFWVELVGAFEVGGINLIVRHNELKDTMIGMSGEVATITGSSLTKVVVSVNPGNALTMTRYNSAADNNFRFAFYDASGALVKRAVSTDLTHTEEVPPKSTTFRISYSTNLTVKLERGRKSSEYTLAPEDAQEQIDSINQGLADTNKLIAETPVPYVGPTAPTNPKKGDQWWVKDASNHVTAFKQWDGSKWVDSMIQQSLLNIVTLNSVTLNSATINSPDIKAPFDYTGPDNNHFQGVTQIKDGAVNITWKIPENNQTGNTTLNASGLESIIRDPKGTMISSARLQMGELYLSDDHVSGSLNEQDAYRNSTQSIQYLGGWGDWGNGAGWITVTRNGRMVTLSGYPKQNGSSNFSNIAQLPEWAKPTRDVNLPAMSLNSSVQNPMAAKLVVNTNGVLSATFTQQSGYVAISASYFGKDIS